MTTEQPETNPTTMRLSVEIVHSRPLSLEITAVEYRVDLHVPYVEERLSQLGEALVGPRGCFLVDRHRIPGVINLDELEAAVFKAERKRRRDAERASAMPEVGQ